MKFQLISIKGEGFLTFKNPFELSLEKYLGQTLQIDGQNLDDPSALSNASGKSSLLETINWGFFGELCRSYHYNEEIINKDSNYCTISIRFNLDNQCYNVTRSLKRKQNTQLDIFDGEGKPLWEGSTYTVKQQQLEKLIGMNKTAFLCCTMFGADFMDFPELTPSVRANVLSSIRGLNRFELGSKRSTEKKNILANDIQARNADLKKYEGRLEELHSHSYSTNSEQFELDRERQIKDLENLKVEILQQKLNAESQKEKEKEQLIERIFKIEEEMSLFSSEHEGEILQDNLTKVTNLLMELHKNEGLIFANICNISSQIKEMEGITGVCTLCKQPITEEHKKQEILKLSNQKKIEDSNMLDIKNKIRALEQDQYNLQQQQIKLKEIRREKAEKEKLLKNYQLTLDNIDLKYNLQLYNQKLESIEKNLEQIKIKENPYKKLEQERQTKIQEGEEIINNKTKEIEILEKEKTLYEFWITGFRKIRLMLFDSMLDKFESLTNSLLTKYSNNLNVRYSTQRETKDGNIKDEFVIEVLDSKNRSLSYEMYSGGERQKIKLAISMALAKMIQTECNTDIGFIAFDEPNDALDNVAKEINFNLFNDLAKNGKLVMITDHDALFKNRGDNSILVVKKDGESVIQY